MSQKAKKRMNKHTLRYSVSFKSTSRESLLHLQANTQRKTNHSPVSHQVHIFKNKGYKKRWGFEMETAKGFCSVSALEHTFDWFLAGYLLYHSLHLFYILLWCLLDGSLEIAWKQTEAVHWTYVYVFSLPTSLHIKSFHPSLSICSSWAKIRVKEEKKNHSPATPIKINTNIPFPPSITIMFNHNPPPLPQCQRFTWFIFA